MNLKDFQQQINPTILERGRKYFNDNRVIDLQEVDDEVWCGYVMGSEGYIVDVTVDRFKIKKFSCDCPYEDMLCKHVVAVLFSICENKGLLKTANAKTTTVKSNKLTLKKLIDKIEEKELKEFIAHYSKINKGFKSDFELFFAHKDENFDVQEQVSSQIRAAIKKYSKRNYIDYRSSNSLARELSKIFKQGEQYLLKGNLLDASSFSKTFMEETLPILGYCDDSSGLLSDVIGLAVDFYVDIAYQSPIHLKENIADYLKSEIQNLLDFDYGDYGHSLTQLYMDLCSDLNREDEFIVFSQRMIQQSKLDNPYNYEYFLSILINFFIEVDRMEDAEKLIQENIHLPMIRTILVNELIEERELDAAKKLIHEGILLAQKDNHLGLVMEWEDILLRIAELQGDTTKIREYLEDFALKSSFNKSYYQKWKETYTQEEWRLVIEKKIKIIHDNVLKKQKSLRKSMQMPDYVLLHLLGQIFVEEEMYDRLMNLVSKQTDLQTILQYHHTLHPLFPKQLIGLYIPLLNEKADLASDRSSYSRLLQVVDLIYRDIPYGRNTLIEQVLAWKNLYKRRPAMLDEIDKFLLNVS